MTSHTTDPEGDTWGAPFFQVHYLSRNHRRLKHKLVVGAPVEVLTMSFILSIAFRIFTVSAVNDVLDSVFNN